MLNFYANENPSSMDNEDDTRPVANPFSLIKLAYNACGPNSREAYNTKTHGVSVDLQECCKYLMAPGDKLRTVLQPEAERLDVCSIAAFNGHIDCLRQAHIAGIPWSWRTTENACRAGHVDCLAFVHKNGCEMGDYIPALSAACAGQICTLEYAWNNGFAFPSNLCTMIARFGSLESLRHVRSLGFEWDTTTTAAAARFNQLDFLKYLREHGCPWDTSTCYNAAQNGNIKCLKYAHTNGCEWDFRTCYMAAQNGHIRCLKYAHTNGCEWNIYTPLLAAMHQRRRCFRYAIENGCPWPSWLSQNMREIYRHI